MHTSPANIPFTPAARPTRVRTLNPGAAVTLSLHPEARVTAALLPHVTPGVIMLRLSDGRQTCIGLGGPAPGLRAGALRGLTEDQARELTERHEAAHVRRSEVRRAGTPQPQRWTTLGLSLEG